jgi:Dolichyl-phosphate-mannose-protein mannosyltransferase
VRVPLLLLIAVLAGASALHAYRAEHPTSYYQSADERAYGTLALNIAEQGHYGDRSTGMSHPLHWPPGAPVLFALAHKLAPREESARTRDIPAAYWAQALVSVGTILTTFGLASALCGTWGGLLAAALVGFYPPLVLATADQLSEPLGALLVTSGFCALAWAVEQGWAPGYAVGGALLGLSVLTRADLLLVPLIVAVVSLLSLPRRSDLRRRLATGGALAAAACAVVVPWVVYASIRADSFVPVTEGGATALFVGTYAPGDGHTVGMKRALEQQVKRFRPTLRDKTAFEIPAGIYMDMVAARHPSAPRETAILREAWRNFVKYGLGDPPRFVGMMGDKVQRMWSGYARGSARPTSAWIRAWHVALVIGAFAGLVASLWRCRSAVLAAAALTIVYSTALHAIVVAQARYNLPLMPLLVAAGVSGWVLWHRAGALPENARAELCGRAVQQEA